MKFSVVLTVLVFSIFSFVTMLHIKTDVGLLYKERGKLLNQQAVLRESMKVQQAELAHLTEPSRLEKFADMAGMVSIEISQIAPVNVSYVLGEVW